MEKSCNPMNDRDLIWKKIVGLGERSIRKSYYPQLRQRIAELERAHEELREAHDKLEQRVQERTAELRKACERVEAEMAERKQVEEQLRQAQKMQAIGTLAGGIAHDFNNMLAVIIGNAELARDDVEDIAGARENIEQILAASKRAKDLVKQILAFSRKTQQRRNPLRLRALIEETMALLRGSLPSTIQIKFDARTESDCILGDSAQIQQVLINLATNGAHAMREKGGTLSVSLSDIVLAKETAKPDSDMSPGRYVKLTVSDTGIGMRADVLKRIFEPFFTTKEAGQGTGMGLAVAYGIIKSHGGTITVESSPDRGSVFTVFLPQAPVNEGHEKEEREDVPRGRERVLLIDDEPLVIGTASKTLRRLGYDVVTALSGSQALELFFKDPHRFDIVITDQVMPDFTGTDVAARMLETRKDLPVILVTGYGEIISSEKATSAGIREFVMKPIEKKALAVTIRRAIDARR